MTIIYEVTLQIDSAIADEYDAWLRGHVADMLALPGFLSAEISAIEDGEATPAQISRVVHYRLRDHAALDAYFRDHAERMRDDGLKRFGKRFRASRRILSPLDPQDAVSPRIASSESARSRMPRALVIMGVSGCGKTTVGKALAKKTGWAFLEGDTLHSESSVAKMSAGIPLTDENRRPWLDRIAEWIAQRLDAGESCIVACSALRRIYRDRLRAAGKNVCFAYLEVPREILLQRMQQRNHFMPASLLESQLQTLEEPGADENALSVTATGGVSSTVAQIKDWLQSP